MNRRKENYYAPSEYERYKNSMKAKRNLNDEESKYSVHTDEYFINQLQTENSRYIERKNEGYTQMPQRPVNFNPTQNTQTEEFSSVYDKIAQKRKNSQTKPWIPEIENEYPKENVSNEESSQEVPLYSSDMQFPNTTDDEVAFSKEVIGAVQAGKKLYNQAPLTEDEMQMFIKQITDATDFDEDAVEEEYYTREDIVGMCEYYRRKYSRKMWITLICSLSFFCILLAMMYLYLNGFLY